MNILLLDGLPEDYKGIPLSSDFRNMINVNLILLEDETLNEHEKVACALHQLYEEIPDDVHKAVDGLKWFYTRGKSDEEQGWGKSGNTDNAFSFSQDANMIYAAFYATYRINLAAVDYLHWWEFMALFECLPEDTLIQRVMHWRTADLSGMRKEERKHILKMRDLYALKSTGRKPMTVEEINQQTKDRVAQRFADAQKKLEMNAE